MAREFFSDVADALREMLPRAHRDFHAQVWSRNLKVWFESQHEHYEVQQLGRAPLKSAHIDAASGLEIGFHAEHPTPSRNDEVLARLGTSWRRALGDDAVAGPFIGRREIAGRWRRLSEVWTTGELDGADAALEAADRLALYITTIEPLRTATKAAAGTSRSRSRPSRRA